SFHSCERWPRRSMCRVTAIDSERVFNHEARAGAAQPEYSGGDFLRPAQPTDRLFLRDVFHRFRLFGDHGGNHMRFERAGAHGIYADASGCIFKSSALGEADHAVFGGMIDGPTGNADEASDRRIVHDGATLLLAHLEQFVLHTEPHTAEIDRIHAIEL